MRDRRDRRDRLECTVDTRVLRLQRILRDTVDRRDRSRRDRLGCPVDRKIHSQFVQKQKGRSPAEADYDCQALAEPKSEQAHS